MIPVLRTEKLCKSFSNGGTQQHVIKKLDLEIMEGDLFAVADGNKIVAIAEPQLGRDRNQ